ncbi:MAG: hypothetical protein Q9162_000340 [Coniocarpon cinnabarinum]
MIMVSPHPFAQDTLSNFPLDQGGSDYPCKQRPGVYGAAKGENKMPVGAPQTLSFQGSAVHGGGSCQVSLTTDKNPTKDSKFKVIHSIIGGCPSNKTAGNLPENSAGSGANTYTYSIPDTVPNGDYALAWTWFNKIGNREMYMNCAPVTVSGSKGSPDTFNKLPDMFIANVGAPTIKTTDSKNVVFPNPGDSVETDSTVGNAPPSCPPSSNGCTVPPSGGGGASAAGGSSGGSAGGSSGAGAPPAAAAPAPQASSPGAQGPAGSSSSSGAQGGAASPAPASPGVAPKAGSVPCNNPGQVVCIGSAQFGICDMNNFAVPQPLAQGTHCQGGKIAKRSVGGFSHKARHAAAHASH